MGSRPVPQPDAQRGVRQFLLARHVRAVKDNVELYTEFGYSKKKTNFHNTPSGVSGSWGYPGGPVNASSGPGATVLGADHPDNPLGVDARLRYAAFDVGPRITHNDQRVLALPGRAQGKFGEWDYRHGVPAFVDQADERRARLPALQRRSDRADRSQQPGRLLAHRRRRRVSTRRHCTTTSRPPSTPTPRPAWT